MSLDLAIIKTLVTNKKHSLDFSNDCDSKLFSTEMWNFANLVVSYVKTYKEIPTERIMLDKLTNSNPKQIEYVKKVWSDINSFNYNEKEYKYDLEKLKKRYAEKQISLVKESLLKFEAGNDGVTKAVADMQKACQTIKSLNQTKAYERKTLKEAVPLFVEEYNAKMTDPEFDKGLRTGYSCLDESTDGLRPGELILIGGESGAGKSMLLMNMAIQLWLQNNTLEMDETKFGPGQHVLYFSLEMPFKPCLNRVLSRMSGAPSKLIRNAKLNADDALRLKKTLKFIKKYPFQFEIIDIPRGATMESLEALYEEAKANYDPKIVVIDYLGLMDYSGGGEMEDWLKLGKISEKIHEFARVHNIVALSAVQLNRAKSKDMEEKIGLHRIGRSALIMQNANIAIQIETRPKEKEYPDMNYHLIKNRDGDLSSGKLIKNLACGTLIDDKVEEDPTTFEMRDINDISDKMEFLDE